MCYILRPAIYNVSTLREFCAWSGVRSEVDSHSDIVLVLQQEISKDKPGEVGRFDLLCLVDNS